MPTTRYGTASRWSVDGRTSALRNTFLQVKVPAAPTVTKYSRQAPRHRGDAASVQRQLGVRRDRAGRLHHLQRLERDRPDWNNQPARGTLLSSKGGYAADTWVTWDVTSAVPSAGGTLSFRVETTEKNWLGFESREDANGRGPELMLTTEPLSSSTPTPTPTASPSPSTSPTATPTTAPTGTAAERLGWGAPVAGDKFNYTGVSDSTNGASTTRPVAPARVCEARPLST